MNDVVGTLLEGRGSVTVEMWHSFWDRLQEGAGPERCESAVALLASLITQEPDSESVGALVDSLDERRAHPVEHDAVNVVGTGGGPSTFNVSTAAAFVAAAAGTRIVKSGSRAYTSRCGSIDVLELLGVPIARSQAAADESLERFGIAFPGAYVYPPELTLLAKNILPVEMRTLGRFFNSTGPFLAAVPARCQVTGVADPCMLPLLEHLATHHCTRHVWLCSNASGVDELLSFEANLVRRDDGTELRVTPQLVGAGPGSLADLSPEDSAEAVVAHFRALLAGDAPSAALETVALNAASVIVAGGDATDWGEAFRSAGRAIEDGDAIALLARISDRS